MSTLEVDLRDNTEGLVKLILKRSASDLLDNFEFCDLLQSCQLAIHKNAGAFDKSRGKWSTFVALIVRTTLGRLRQEAKRIPVPHDFTEWHQHLPGWAVAACTTGPIFPSDTKQDLVDAFLSLDPRQQSIVSGFAKGRKQKGLADEWGVLPCRISQIQKEAFQIMRQKIEGR